MHFRMVAWVCLTPLPLAFLKHVTLNFTVQKNVSSFLFLYISIISLVFLKTDQMPFTNNCGARVMITCFDGW